jgi:hypothetical protein
MTPINARIRILSSNLDLHGEVYSIVRLPPQGHRLDFLTRVGDLINCGASIDDVDPVEGDHHRIKLTPIYLLRDVSQHWRVPTSAFDAAIRDGYIVKAKTPENWWHR